MINSYFEIFHLIPWFPEKCGFFLQTTNVGIKRSVEHLYHEWNMPSLRVSYPVSWKSFREMEKIDRIAQHGDYPMLLSYSPRKQAAACARANARLYRLPICYSIKQITGMQFKVVPSQSRLHEFRAISHGCMHTYTCVCVCGCVRCAYIHIHAFPISLFRKSPLIHLARKCGCCATEIRRLRGLVCGEMQKISERTESRWKEDISNRIILYYRDIHAKESEIVYKLHS